MYLEWTSCIYKRFAMKDFKFLYLLMFVLTLSGVLSERQEICSAESFDAECPQEAVIVMEAALYGRMEHTRCIEVDVGLGCENDVLSLADEWCSGQQECHVQVPNQELKAANVECKALTSYLQVEYSCVTVSWPRSPSCLRPTPVTLHGNEGYLASHVTDQTGCGSSKAPWIIETPYGQIIELWLIDFGALVQQSSTLRLTCPRTLGYVVERSLGSNFTICGSDQRKKHLYTSKTNKLEITLLQAESNEHRPRYLIRYNIVGCSDLTPPAHAWYKREGNEAVIGCKSNDRIWRLYCNGNTWDGVVGNCSDAKGSEIEERAGMVLPFSSIIFLTCVVCGALLLIIIVIVAGAVYVKKQSIRHQLKLRSDYAFTTLPSSQYYTIKKPVYGDVRGQPPAVTADRVSDSQPLVQICDRTLNPGTNTIDSSVHVPAVESVRAN